MSGVQAFLDKGVPNLKHWGGNYCQAVFAIGGGQDCGQWSGSQTTLTSWSFPVLSSGGVLCERAGRSVEGDLGTKSWLSAASQGTWGRSA